MGKPITSLLTTSKVAQNMASSLKKGTNPATKEHIDRQKPETEIFAGNQQNIAEKQSSPD